MGGSTGEEKLINGIADSTSDTEEGSTNVELQPQDICFDEEKLYDAKKKHNLSGTNVLSLLHHVISHPDARGNINIYLYLYLYIYVCVCILENVFFQPASLQCNMLVHIVIC